MKSAFPFPRRRRKTRAGLVFGKLPAHGDFVRRGVAPALGDAWDAALSASLTAAKAEFGEGFAVAYMGAPPWRFALSDGKAWLAGAIAPSIDASGRMFPVIAGHGAERRDECGSIAARCEAALFSAIEERLTADALLNRIERPQEPEQGEPAREGWWLDGGEAKGVKPIAGTLPPGLIPAMLRAGSAA